MNDPSSKNQAPIKENALLKKRIQELEQSEAELRRAEKALRESEDRYRDIVENAIEGVYQISPEGQYISVNPALARLHGIESPQELMRAVTDGGSQLLAHPGIRQRFRETIEKEGAVVNFEFELHRKDGSKIWVSTNARVVRDEKGTALYYEGKVEDITRRKQAEEALRESEDRHRLLVNSINKGIFVAQDGMVKFANPAFLEMAGSPTHAPLPLPFAEFIHPDDREMVTDRHVRRMRGEKFDTRYEFRTICPDGRIKWIELDSVMIQWKERPAILCFASDVTNLKEAADGLAARRVQISDAMDLARIAYWSFDLATGDFIFNDHFWALCGTTAEREGGYRMARAEYAKRFFHPDDVWLLAESEEKRNRSKGEFFHDLEHRIIRRDGEVRHILARIHVTKDAEGRIIKYYGANQDITERKLLEEKLEAISITDELTGLHNRRGFLTLCEQQLKVASRTRNDLTLFFADLDDLKWINDTLGHGEGDAALVSAADALRDTFRGSDIIARIGGDEFAILAVGAGDAGKARDRLNANIAKFNEHNEHPWRLSLSVGMALSGPAQPCTLESLIARADASMYDEKQKKKEQRENAASTHT